jgi:hypothetical protein
MRCALAHKAGTDCAVRGAAETWLLAVDMAKTERLHHCNFLTKILLVDSVLELYPALSG